MEIIELKVLDTDILNKPKQMVRCDYRLMPNLTINKSLVIDIMLHSVQSLAYTSFGKLTHEQLFDTWFSINLNDFLRIYTDDKNTKYNNKFLNDMANDMLEYKFISYDKMKIEYGVLFPNIKFEYDSFLFKLNTELIKAIFSSDKIIGNENSKKGAYYISYNYRELHKDYNLTITEILMYQNILYDNFKMRKNKSITIPIDEFKGFCGIKSKNNRYVKSTILIGIKKINNILSKHENKMIEDIQIGVDFDETGKYKSIKNVNLWIMGEPLIDVDNL